MEAVGIVLVIECADVTSLMFSRMVARLSGTGIAVALVASLLVTRALSALLYDTSSHDLATFIAVPSILALVALGASMFGATFVQAWRQSSERPTEVKAINTDAATRLRYAVPVSP